MARTHAHTAFIVCLVAALVACTNGQPEGPSVQTIGCINCGNSKTSSTSVSGSTSSSVATSNSKTSQGLDVNGIFTSLFGGGRKMLQVQAPVKVQTLGCMNCGNSQSDSTSASLSGSKSNSQSSSTNTQGLDVGGIFKSVFGGRKLASVVVPTPGPRGPNGGDVVRSPAGLTVTVPRVPTPYRPRAIPKDRFTAGRHLLQCRDTSPCPSWGPSQCDRPGVPDRCPVMCGVCPGGPGGPGGAPGGTVIQVIGCKDCGNSASSSTSVSRSG